MEKECSQCHRLFDTSHAEVDVCPDCLRKEFKTAASSLDAEERKALVEEYEASARRQQQRASRMREDFAHGGIFSWNGKLRFVFGVSLFLLCGLVFLLSSESRQEMAFQSLDLTAQRIISVMLCMVSAALVLTSSRRYPYVVWPCAVLMLVGGWYMPMLHPATDKPVAETSADSPAGDASEESKETIAEKNRALSASDLDVFRQQKSSAPDTVHYAIYMDKQDARTRSIVREALVRLLGAEYARAYTRNDGALYVVSNVRGKMKNISRTLNRFGHITYSSPSDGIYEVRFDPERTNMVSRYPAEVLMEPSNASYVSANLGELNCLDAMRIRTAAKNLHNTKVQILRNEVREALLAVMQEPWNTDFDTYSALAEAIVDYALPQKDAGTIEVCRKFFRTGLAQKREIPESVTLYLVREVPDEMVEPIVEFWCENPIAWTEVMRQLGGRTQEPLLAKLRSADDLRSIGTIIRYLKDYGDARAIDDIKPFLNHQDSIIRHTAQETIRVLENRK